MSLDAYFSDSKTPASVAAVVIARHPQEVGGALDAIERQVYEPQAVFVVGGGSAAAEIAAASGAEWVPTVAEVADRAATATYLWLLHDEARPRPDALSALVVESYRVDASIAGSKLLDRAAPDRLLSVGLATDVFEVPYSGIDDDELDQHQYEVVRDVAVVYGASMLVRRDLLKGLAGLDRKLAPEASAIDLCQRARLRGARVVVVPSSEVLYPARLGRRTVPWDEEAGRIRAMIKVYGVLTLLWTLPLAFATMLLEAVAAPFVGRWTLFNTARAWAWNLLYLPSTFAARRRARRARVVGDEELFRYQVRGSARLRAVGTEIGDRIRERFPEGTAAGLGGIVEAGQSTLRSPGFVAALVALLFVVIATRNIWGGTLPAVGYTLPPSESAAATLRAYGGGWNVAGLGSPAPLHPAVGLIALVQFVLFDRAELTAAVLTVLALGAGVVGMARLLRSWKFGPLPAYVGGVVLVAGPAAQALGGRTEWTALLALGALPWVLRVALRRWPSSWRGRIGRIAAVAWLTAIAAAGLPLLLVVPLAALRVWAVLGEGLRWPAVLQAGAGAVLAVPLLFPWFGVIGLREYLEGGTPAYWEVWWPAAVLVLVAAGAGLVAGDRLLSGVAGWGALLGTAGVALARTATYDLGRDVAAGGMVLAALGTAAVVAAAFEAGGRMELSKPWRRPAALAGVLAGLAITVSVLVPAVGGRGGLPGDVYGEALRFTAAQVDDPHNSRALVVGPAEALPGDSRMLEGAAYRVVSAPLPRLWEARLAEPRLGDRELESTLRKIVEGEIARAGEALAPFGIRWIVIIDSSPFEAVLGGQLDLIPLPSLARPVFLSEVDDAVRAQAADGTVWEWVAPDYRGPLGGNARVFVAENADQRWDATGWEQANWANELDADGRVISFATQSGFRREAQLAGGLLILYLLLAVWGTGRKSR